MFMSGKWVIRETIMTLKRRTQQLTFPTPPVALAPRDRIKFKGNMGLVMKLGELQKLQGK